MPKSSISSFYIPRQNTFPYTNSNTKGRFLYKQTKWKFLKGVLLFNFRNNILHLEKFNSMLGIMI